jgi:AAA ATPase domain
MNRADNPYTPGAGWKPRKLAGREAELEQFQLLLKRMSRGDYEPSPIFTGLRGVGKTVLLLECEALAREAGWATHDVYEVGSQADFRITFAKLATILLRSMSLKQRMKKRAQAALGVVKAFAEFAPPGFRFRLEVAPSVGRADSGDPEEDLADLLDEIGHVARAGGTGAVFLIDELQNLDSASLAAVSVAFQRMVKKNLPVALVGAGLPTVSDGLFAAKGYSDRLFNHFVLGRLSRAAARTALISPAAVLGVKYEPDAVEYILDETDGYPYFIQEFGRVAWNESEQSPVGLDVVRVVRDTVRERLADNFYGRRFNQGTDTEQRYLAAMASLDGEGPFRTSAVSQAYGAKSTTGTSLQRDGLIRKGLIWSPRRGQVAFTVPRFGEFIREFYPLELLD